MPSSAFLAEQGVKAVSAGNYQQGIDNLTEALKERPAPLWLLERSKAYLRTNELDLALYDAEKALRVAFDRASRDHMIEAQIRRAVTLFRMNRYADADICAFWAIKLCDGAKASEDDGQQKKVDNNGDYTASVKELNDAEKPAKGKGLATAMGSDGRTKKTSMRNQASTWRLQALTQMENLPAGHAGRKVNVSAKYPTPGEAPPAKKAEPKKVEPKQDTTDSESDISRDPDGTLRGAWEVLWKKYRIVHAKNDVRSSFYQTDTTLNVDFFVKGVSKGELTVDAKAQSVTLKPVPRPTSDSIQLLLFGKIKPSETKCTVKSMKIELVLQKEVPGKWPTLRRENAEIIDNIALGSTPPPPFNQFYEFVTDLGYKTPKELEPSPGFGQDQVAWYASLLDTLRGGFEKMEGSTMKEAAPGPSTLATSAEPSAQNTAVEDHDTMDIDTPAKAGPLGSITNVAKPGSSAPAYPTSSKKGPKNWDNIDDDDEEDEKEKGDVNTFFQSLYKNADEDTKRAMMKSYVESNGTSLSTSWSEAKDKTYETQAPDGAEAKKWDK